MVELSLWFFLWPLRFAIDGVCWILHIKFNIVVMKITKLLNTYFSLSIATNQNIGAKDHVIFMLKNIKKSSRGSKSSNLSTKKKGKKMNRFCSLTFLLSPCALSLHPNSTILRIASSTGAASNFLRKSLIWFYLNSKRRLRFTRREMVPECPGGFF